MSFYVTTAIPYVNADPHLGHALELVQADVLARHRRLRGEPVRFLTGTDDNALKNVAAAKSAGRDVRAFVDSNAARFRSLRGPLDLSFDDFISTSADPRHAPGVERLWRASADRGDFYRRRYEGLYCAGCEQFIDGTCPEHPHDQPVPVAEENWFFRLSRYADRIGKLLETGEVRVEPQARRNEVLAFVRGGLSDFSVSRPAARADGWGIPVPGDPSQVVYVWWDALANYVTALGEGDEYERWWAGSTERVHVIGKGIVRFHAVYWLALLLSAGLPLPTAIFVHDYLTVDGAKLSKSAGNSVDPQDLVARFGTDAVRWWLLREVAPVGDTDFTVARLVHRANQDLANGLGNLVNRTLTLVHSRQDGWIGDPAAPYGVCAQLPGRIDRALARFDLRAATDALWTVVDEGNRLVESSRPWQLTGPALDAVLATLVHSCRVLAKELEPFLPSGAARLRTQLGTGNQVGPAIPAFPRLVPAS
ncbi:methionine--tRNA ligase [Dactylosporangium fulvum]|uniref:Methionine--tRNA ligase n=1 Tax=Dactylosporangium fulvum TaxID=53359 RepID=A0ABY5VQF4_9ACTN|nr:methionine--tRNA ligase [Dactylosporangium fulvum]UWP78718.1 methionine--tRNA ligase [Dactylosporangium fulvum]